MSYKARHKWQRLDLLEESAPCNRMASAADDTDLLNDTRHDSLFLKDYGDADSGAINLARTEEWTMNSRGQRLHLRSRWPSGDAKAAILSLHGYGAHCSRPTHEYVATELTGRGFVYVTLDFHGHGYSEGIRGLVEDPLHLVDDVFSALAALYAEDATTARNVDRPLVGLRLFVMGHSMGGGTTLLVSNILQHGTDAATPVPPAFTGNRTLFDETVRPAFSGAILACPVVDMGVSPIVQDWLVGSLAWWLPRGSVPTWIMNENDSNHLVWASRRYRSYIHADGYPNNPEGLSYGGNIYFRTLSSVLQLARHVQATLAQASFPFVVFHDEAGDIVVPAAGSARLVREAPCTAKTFEPVPGGLHDILANRVVEFTTKTIEWLDSRIK